MEMKKRRSSVWPFAACGLAGILMLVSAPAIGAEKWVGERFKFTGAPSPDGFKVTRIQPRDARRDRRSGRISGPLDAIDLADRRLSVGPVSIVWTDQTTFSGSRPEELSVGQRVEVRVRASTKLVAERVEPDSGSDQIEILGTVSSAKRQTDGDVLLTVLGLDLEIPGSLGFRELSLLRDPEDKRPADQATVEIGGRTLTIGGEVSTRVKHEGGVELRSGAEDDKTEFEAGIELELFYDLHPRVKLFLEGEANYERDLIIERGNRFRDSTAERGETWLYARLPEHTGFAVQVGRQAFREPREWWWDDDLDAFRVYWNRFPFSAEFGIAREIARVSSADDRIDPEDDHVLRVLGRTSWRWHPDHELTGFWLRQSDGSRRNAVGELVGDDREDPFDARLMWFGLRESGDFSTKLGDVDYWIDLALVRGDEISVEFSEEDGGSRVTDRRRRSVRGRAFDLGLTWAPELRGNPSFSFGYAVGSGDDDRDGQDRAFRQTGLQDNNGRFNGVNRFRYYGELFDPELSNMKITTLSVGFPVLTTSSVEILYHHYRQHKASAFLRDANIDADPTGGSRSLGQELDVVVGLEEWVHLELEIGASIFRSGSGFGRESGEFAYGGFFRMDWNF